jgi:hypothetical protein
MHFVNMLKEPCRSCDHRTAYICATKWCKKVFR